MNSVIVHRFATPLRRILVRRLLQTGGVSPSHPRRNRSAQQLLCLSGTELAVAPHSRFFSGLCYGTPVFPSNEVRKESASLLSGFCIAKTPTIRRPSRI